MHFLSLLIIAALAVLTAANPVNDKIQRDLGCPPSFTTCWQTAISCAVSGDFDCNGPTSDCLQYCQAGLCFTCPGQCWDELDCSSITKERDVKRDLDSSLADFKPVNVATPKVVPRQFGECPSEPDCWDTVYECSESGNGNSVDDCQLELCYACPNQCYDALGCDFITRKRDLVSSCSNCQAWYNGCYYGAQRNCLQYGLGSPKEAECAAECQEDLCFDCPQNCGCP